MRTTYDLVCVGMALVDSIIRGFSPEPVSPTGFLADSNTLCAGGEAVNAAAAGARLGLKTGVVCALGKDGAGELVRDALRRGGVDLLGSHRCEATPVSTLFVHADGTRKSVTVRSRPDGFHPERDPSAFTCARALLLGSLFRAPFDDPDVVRSVLTHAARAGQLTAADAKLPRLRPLKARDLRDSLPLIDYLTPNEDEARYLSGRDDPDGMADALLDYGVKHVVVKLGAGGCLMKAPGMRVRLPAYAVRAVDATGAGDHFAAGLISELLRGETAERALRFANACGAVCTTAVGAAGALTSREQVLRFMEETPLRPLGTP